MGTPENISFREARWLTLVLSAWAYALCAALLRLAIHAFDSPFAADSSYRLGCLLGVGTDWVLGLCVGFALAIPSRRSGRIVALAIAILLLLGVAAGAHYHAVFNRLPTAGTLARLHKVLTLRSSVEEHAPLWRLALEAMVPASLIVWGIPKLATHLATSLRARSLRRLLGTIGVASAAASGFGIEFGSGQIYYGSSGALVHVLIAEEAEALAPPAPATTSKTQELLSLVQARLLPENSGAPLNDDYPYCKSTSATAVGAKRSVILLLLEGVDERILAGSFQGKPLMPNLARLAAAGVHFERFYASGYQTNQAMPAVFSGVPAVPLRNLLQHAPLARLRGLPLDLRRAGFSSVYFHGADLSFEQKRAFLKEIGFDDLFEPNPLDDVRLYGWGEPDGVMFEKLRGWIENHHARAAEDPYFATAFTLSTHDPYAWPVEHERRFQGTEPFTRLAETVSYLDDELLRFYQWYEQHEKPRGTVLLITGDHAPRIPEPTDPPQTSTGEFEYRFRVPFIVLGASEAEMAQGRAAAERPGGLHDIPQTLLGFAGVTAEGCYQGRNLFAPEPPPNERWVVSVAGESLEFVYVHETHRRWMLSMKTDTLTAFDPLADPQFRSPLVVSQSESDAVREFLRAYLGLNRYLIEQDKFAPIVEQRVSRPSLPRVQHPLLVAHEGGASGKEGSAPNSSTAIEAAIVAGFQWVKLDLQLTSDSVPVLNHDSAVKLKDGSSIRIAQKTWAELSRAPLAVPLVSLDSVIRRFANKVGLCLELKRQEHIFQTFGLARETLKLLAPLPRESRIVIDSFSHTLLATPEQFGTWPIGYDLPRKEVDPSWLDFSAERGFDWVYVDEQFLTADVIRRAHHLGIKVMMYTVNDLRRLDALGDELPDGIVSDVAEPWKNWRGRNWLEPTSK